MKKRPTTTTPRLPEGMRRGAFLAHTFTDRKKEQSRKACRKGNY